MNLALFGLHALILINLYKIRYDIFFLVLGPLGLQTSCIAWSASQQLHCWRLMLADLNSRCCNSVGHLQVWSCGSSLFCCFLSASPGQAITRRISSVTNKTRNAIFVAVQWDNMVAYQNTFSFVFFWFEEMAIYQ